MSFLHTTRNRICSVSAINLTNLDRRGQRSYLALVIRRFLSIDNNNRRRTRKEMSNALFVSLWWIREGQRSSSYHLSLVSSKSSWDRVQLDTRSNGIIPVWWTGLVMYKIAALVHWPVSGGEWNPLMGVPNEIIKISQRGATKSSLFTLSWPYHLVSGL